MPHFRPFVLASPPLGVALPPCASLALAQPRFESASPTAGGKTSQQANQTADKTLYQSVDYVNKNKKGPQVIVIPGEIKSNNATFLQKFTANNIADFGELELSNANFTGARAQQPGPGAARVRARLQPGRPASRAQVSRHGQAEDDQVRRQVRHPEDRAGRLRAEELRRRHARPDGGHRWARSPARAAARRRARSAARRSARCTAARRPACG